MNKEEREQAINEVEKALSKLVERKIIIKQIKAELPQMERNEGRNGESTIYIYNNVIFEE